VVDEVRINGVRLSDLTMKVQNPGGISTPAHLPCLVCGAIDTCSHRTVVDVGEIPTTIHSIEGYFIYPHTEDEPMTVEEALYSLQELVKCRCDEAWTARGRHEPNSTCDYAEEVEVITAALEGRDAAG
jgi:hypothetical protein